MKEFYYVYEDLKYNIKKKGLLECENAVDDMLEQYKNHRNIGLVKLRKAQMELRFKSEQVAEEILLGLLNDIRDDVRLYARRDLFRLYVEQNRTEDALMMYKQLEMLETSKYTAMFQKTLLLRTQNRMLEASKIMTEILKSIDKIDDLQLLTLCLIEIEGNYWNAFKKINYDLMKKLLLKLIADSNNRENLCRRYIGLAKIELIKNNYSEALNLYKKALATPELKTRELAIIGICKIYFNLGDTNLQDYLEFEELKNYNSSDAVGLLSEIYCANKNYDKAEMLLNSVPEDDGIIYFKAKLARIKKDYIESLKLYKRCFIESKDFALRINSIFSIIKIYTDMKRYQDALEMLNDNRETLLALNTTGYYQIYAFLCKVLGMNYSEGYYSYSINQILNYDLNHACEHIKKHEDGFKNIEFYTGDLSNFLINLQERLDDAEQILSTVFDYYKIKVFSKDGQEIFIKAIVVPCTKDIITCYVDDQLIFTEFDMDEEVEVKQKEKVIKRKSQIDKFNERYNLKRD